MIGRRVEMEFDFYVDAETTDDVERKNADLHRLFEMLRAFADVHCHDGFYLTLSSFENKE